MKKIRIGYPWDFYYYKRNIVNKLNDVEYVKVTDYYKLMSVVLYLMNKAKFLYFNQLLDIYKFSYSGFDFHQVDLLHFFNSVSYGEKPWLSTFETYIPRFPMLHKKKIRKGLAAIAADSCKKLIALSECTVKNEENLMNQFPEYKKAVMQKIVVIPPPQQLFVSNYEEKELQSDYISFIFVGHDFFRKGGMEILRAFSNVKAERNLPIKLTIISKLNTHDHASHAGKEELASAMNAINSHPEWITYERSLPNREVIHLMKNHHIGLLPTWADTYGFSVLEMQASGCPVITTDVRALPEINDHDKGWMINVPKDELGEAYYQKREDRQRMSAIIEKNLENIIINIFDHPDQIRVKAENSIATIKCNHSPKKYADKLRAIYRESLSKVNGGAR